MTYTNYHNCVPKGHVVVMSGDIFVHHVTGMGVLLKARNVNDILQCVGQPHK